MGWTIGKGLWHRDIYKHIMICNQKIINNLGTLTKKYLPDIIKVPNKKEDDLWQKKIFVQDVGDIAI